MPPKIALTCSAIFIAAILPARAGAPEDRKADQAKLVEGGSAFAMDLYAKLKDEKKDKNLFFSPCSISTAFAMAQAGARGNTEAEIAKVLHFTLDRDRLHPAMKGLMEGIESGAAAKGYQFNVANGLALTTDGGMVKKEYKEFLKTQYGAEVFSAGDVKVINDWVAKKTNDKIKDLVKKMSVNSVCFILNAVYFKGDWEAKFDPKDTADAAFTLADGKTVQAPMMNQRHAFNYMESGTLQVLEMPYKGKELSMVVVLPRKADGIKDLAIAAAPLAAWLKGMSEQKVSVSLPKFKMTVDYDLVPPLKSLGMADAFGSTADFTALAGDRPGDVWIAQVLHKAFIEVNEEGSEAAAATAIEMETKSVAIMPLVFRADHPFLFLIRDTRTGAILFMGRVMDPKGL
jgi:serpin B